MGQTNQRSLETKIRSLRAEGKTYREIAKILHVSIAQISRILNEAMQQGEVAPNQPGELASRVFQLLEKGVTLPQIVIKLKVEPEAVKGIYDEWIGLKRTDVNQPNIEKLDQKLMSHIGDHAGLYLLLEKARYSGVHRRNSCANRLNDPEGICRFSPSLGADIDSEDTMLHCAFCSRFRSEEIITIEIPPYPSWPYFGGQ